MMGEAAEAGDVVVVASLETLFRANYARLVRTLAVVSGSQESAADAVQEAFVKAHVHWRLPRQQRLSMALFYVDNLSIAEVAATLGLSDGAVKFHLHQGRDRLRGLFAVQQDAQP